MTPAAQPYVMDYEWLWGRLSDGSPGNSGASATVRLTVTGPNARKAVMAWFDELPVNSFGIRGSGGWIVKEMKWEPNEVILDLTSGGEDVADGIDYATTDAYEALAPAGCALEWEQLPREA